MAEQTSEAASQQSFKKSWGFGTGSVSSELKSASAQIVEDSRLPGSSVSTLLNAFLARYLVWPFCATSGTAYDAEGMESKQFGTLIYTSSQDLQRVPADVLACAIQTHELLGLEDLRASYSKIAQIKALKKSPVPKISHGSPVADATMGTIFAVESNVPLERLAEELDQLNRLHPHDHWVDMVVVLSRGTINYGCQFPLKGLGDFLPPARNTPVCAPMYVHIVAKAHAPFCLNRMCSLLFYYLYLFSPGTTLPPCKEILEGVPKMCMAIAPYQSNLGGQLVPVPLELRFNQFFLFPVGFKVVDSKGDGLGKVNYLPWQDGGGVRVTGKLPIEAVLVFAGKEALSQPIIRWEGEQFSGVIPLSRQGFIEMAQRMARQSRNLYIKPDSRPNWIVEHRGNEGTSSPFVARLFVGICRIRDQALSDPTLRERFDLAFESVVTGLEAVRNAAAELTKTWEEYQKQIAAGEAVRIVNGIAFVEKNIDRAIRKNVDEAIGMGCRVIKDRMRILLEELGFDIGFLFQKEGSFVAGLAKMTQHNPDLAAYIQQTRSVWSERLVLCRNNFEHAISKTLKVKIAVHGNAVTAVQPELEGQFATAYVNRVADRVCCFCEDLLAHALQSRMPDGISITEIPLALRKADIVERFQPALVGGGATIWGIAYHESKFEDH